MIVTKRAHGIFALLDLSFAAYCLTYINTWAMLLWLVWFFTLSSYHMINWVILEEEEEDAKKKPQQIREVA